MITVCVKEDGTVYVINKFKAHRGIGKNQNEVLIWGFNKNIHPELFKEIIKECKQGKEES